MIKQTQGCLTVYPWQGWHSPQTLCTSWIIGELFCSASIKTKCLLTKCWLHLPAVPRSLNFAYSHLSPHNPCLWYSFFRVSWPHRKTVPGLQSNPSHFFHLISYTKFLWVMLALLYKRKVPPSHWTLKHSLVDLRVRMILSFVTVTFAIVILGKVTS